MKKLVFATNNKHKLAEIRAILKDSVEVVSLSDIDCHDDIPETADTTRKAMHLSKLDTYIISMGSTASQMIQV